MNELNLDAESITRNKSYGSFEHLQHLLKVGWSPNSPLIKKFLKENNLTEADLQNQRDEPLNKIEQASPQRGGR